MNSAVRSIILLLVFLLCATSAFAAISKGPYLLFEGANTSMSVLWQTSVSEPSNTLKWGTDTSYSLGSATVTNSATFQHKYTITGLLPGTKYYYQVLNGATVYGSGSFRTAPASSATAVKMFAYGDTRATPGASAHETVASRMRTVYGSDPAFQTIALFAGDWVNADAESNWTSEWFVSGTTYPNMHTLQAEMPITGSRGNHESTGTYYKKYFPEPYVAGFYRSFDYGPVHVTVIDQYTTFTSGSAQYNWIVSDLAGTTKPWKIVVLHEPGWTAAGSHTNNTTVQTVLEPLFEQNGVDLVIGGHNHYYARAVVNNVQHLTLGGGGAGLYTPAAGQPNIVKTASAYHHAEIDINNNILTFTARKPDGTVIETFNVTHSGGATVPGAPTIGTATGGNAQASVAFTAPSSDGGSAITGYTVTSSPGSLTGSGSASPVTVTGLTNGTAYTFTVKATNAVGSGAASAASNSATPATVPGAPTIGTATAGNAQASVVFTAPASNGGSAITVYTVTSSPGNLTGSGSASPVTVTGLTNGTAYTFTVVATNAKGTGAASAASNSVTPSAATIPGAPTIGTATGGNAQASVAFTAPASNGGSAITGYTVTSSPGGFTGSGSASPVTVTGLTNGTAYTFTVVATNAVGSGAASAASNSVTPATVPGAPIIGTATGGNAQASVAFTAPASNGGSVITGYTVTSSPGSLAGSGSASPVTVTGLTNGTAYTFTVKATNAVGSSAASAASNSVTPKGTQTITFANPGAQSFGTTPSLTATATSGLTVAFTSSTTEVCTITTGGALTFVTTGTCTINADQTGNGSYLAATTVSQTFTISLPTYQITLTATGGGSGTIHTETSPSTPDMNCSGTCNSQFPADTLMTLTASTASGSTFTGWSLDCSGFAPCNLLLNGNRNISATFGLGPNNNGPLAMIGQTGLESIAAAYQVSGATGTIMALTGIHSIGSLIFDLVKEIMLKGGYDTLFKSPEQPSVLHGSLTVRDGTLRVENILIRPAP